MYIEVKVGLDGYQVEDFKQAEELIAEFKQDNADDIKVLVIAKEDEVVPDCFTKRKQVENRVQYVCQV